MCPCSRRRTEHRAAQRACLLLSVACSVFPHRQGRVEAAVAEPGQRATGRGEPPLAACGPWPRPGQGPGGPAPLSQHQDPRLFANSTSWPTRRSEGPCAQGPPTVERPNHQTIRTADCLPGTSFPRISRTVTTSVISCDLSNLYRGSARSPPGGGVGTSKCLPPAPAPPGARPSLGPLVRTSQRQTGENQGKMQKEPKRQEFCLASRLSWKKEEIDSWAPRLWH